VNQKLLNLLTAAAFVVIAAFVILPFLPKEIRPTVTPVVEEDTDVTDGK